MADTKIQINRISTESIGSASRSALAIDYMVFSISCSDLKFHDYSHILDLNEEEKNLIRSVYHDGYSEDKNTYYLVSAGKAAGRRLGKAIEKAMSGRKDAMEQIAIRQVDLCSRAELPDHILLNLLLFSLSGRGEDPACYNMVGGLFQVIKYRQDEINTLKYRIDSDMTLFPEVKTFMSKASFEKNGVEIPEGELEYNYDEVTHTMHRAPDSKGKYVMRRSDGGRMDVPYLSPPQKKTDKKGGGKDEPAFPEDGPDKKTETDGISPAEKDSGGEKKATYEYKKGKLTALCRLVALFDETFSEPYGIRIRFESCPETWELRTSQKGMTEKYKQIIKHYDQAIKQIPFSIINTDDRYQKYSDDVVKLLQNLGYLVDNTGSGMPIVLIHRPGYDEAVDSAYLQDWNRQHMIYENLYKKTRNGEFYIDKQKLLNSLNNAVEKYEIQTGILLLYDSSSFDFDSAYFAASFSWRIPGANGTFKESPHEYLLRIDNTGKIKAGNFDDFLDFPVNLAELRKAVINKKTEYAVQIGENINLVYHSNIRTMPSQDYLQMLIQEKLPFSRTEELKANELAGLNDLRAFLLDGNYYYFAGEKSEAMNRVVARAPNARLVIPLNPRHRILIPELLPLMCVPFVRYKQLTVHPFPYKYLREYAQMDAHKHEYRLWEEEQY